MSKWLSGLTEEYHDISGAVEALQNHNRVVQALKISITAIKNMI